MNNRLVESEHPFRPESASLSRRSNTSLTAGFLENLRGKNKNRPIIAQLNINSLRNKFGFLSSHITKYVDILLLSETKLDDSFPTAQFLLNGFCKPYRLDRSSNGGGILLYVRDDIPSRLLTDYKIKDNLELFFVEVNIRKKKWLLGCSYNPHKNNISNHLHHLNKGLDVYLKSYDNILIMGDLNSEVSENCLNGFCNVNSLKTLNSNYTTKALQKKIMHRSRLRNKFLRERTNESKIAYNKQRNICVSFTQNQKRLFCQSEYENYERQ